MWLVRIALSRPYTFIVLALTIMIVSPIAILRTPVDIFPAIDIPTIAIAWGYSGLNAEEMEGTITSNFERTLTTTVDNIEHIESITIQGTSITKVYLQPGASLDTANAQITAISQTVLRGLPTGSQPPLIINFSASSVPILQLGLAGEGLSEQQLNDYALNFVRPQMVTIRGAVLPYPYGGKQRQVMVYVNPRQLLAKGLAPNDILTAIANQNVVLPSGTAKIGSLEYGAILNGSPTTLQEMNNIPVKVSGDSTIYLRDVATVSDGFTPQTNIVRQDGQRSVLITILKNGTASTIDVVNKIRAALDRVRATVPPELKINPLSDQSIFVSAAVNGVIREAIIATALTALMILVFLGSWRSTIIIAVSIPLSILGAVIVLSALGETINIMTLGGLALAVGVLVDNATVTIENIERHLEEGHDLNHSILQGAAQIGTPSLVATLCICIVFLPMFFLSGVSRYLFVPLAESVVFAMLWSYLLSRTLVPTMAMYLLHAKRHDDEASRNPLARLQLAFDRRFVLMREWYQRVLTILITRRAIFMPGFLIVCLATALLVPWLGEDFFPSADNGQMILHMRAKSGTRIEETASLADRVETFVRGKIARTDLESIIDNIGLPYSSINFMHSFSGLVGAGDADIMISLKEGHRPTADYVRQLRRDLPQQFPGTTFYFLPADIVSQILNYGIPSPIDIQIQGRDLDGNRDVANRLLEKVRHVSGVTDARIQQAFDYPAFDISVDRTKAAQGGLTEKDVANSVLNILSGSGQVAPMHFLNRENGVNYNMTALSPQYNVESLQDIRNIPISTAGGRGGLTLGNLATISRRNEMQVITHSDIARTVDIYAAVQDRDLGSVERDLAKLVDATKDDLPRGSFISLLGQIQTMRTSYANLLSGLLFSVVLVYLLIVVNFQSWLDPFIIITALPAALAGIVLFLFFTHTSLSVPALMGAIMCMGVATANSILVVSFARERLAEHGDSVRAAIEAGYTRLRPVLMTALAMIIGMIPMALGLGEGGEENAPLGRAVIGGLILATVATLVFVPAVFSFLHRRHPQLNETTV